MNRYGVVLLLLVFAFSAQAKFQLEDTALSACINKNASKNNWTQATEVTSIKCHNKKIRSTEGLSAFTHLKTLSLYKNQISAIDLTPFTQLKNLNLAGNQLTAITVTNFDSLENLFLFHNPLTELSIIDCPELKVIKANNGQLTRLHMENLSKLEKLYLFDNQLEIIDIESTHTLHYLDVRHNPMPDEFYDYLDGISGLTSLHDGNAEDWQ